MHRLLLPMTILLLIGLLASGCKRETVTPTHHPAKLEDTDQKGIKRVILEPRAAERIGLQTAQVREEMVSVDGKSALRKVVPYGALMYDTKGAAWTYTSPQSLTFVRVPIVVQDIEGDRVILAEGPPPGTVVVTVGAAELMGAEHKYGH